MVSYYNSIPDKYSISIYEYHAIQMFYLYLLILSYANMLCINPSTNTNTTSDVAESDVVVNPDPIQRLHPMLMLSSI